MLLSNFESREVGPSAHDPRFMYTFYSQGNNQATAGSACLHCPFIVLLILVIGGHIRCGVLFPPSIVSHPQLMNANVDIGAYSRTMLVFGSWILLADGKTDV